MDNGIRIGHESNSKSIQTAVEAIINIFSKGRETNMDQPTIVKALEVLNNITELPSINNASISNCYISGTGDKASPKQDDFELKA